MAVIWEEQNEIIQHQRQLLTLYRSVQGYTIDAVTQAISSLQTSIDNMTDIDTKHLLQERKTTLEKTLASIEQDIG